MTARRLLAAVAALVATAAAAAPARAQVRSSATAVAPLRFGIAGGLAQPTSDLGELATTGFNITGTLDFRPTGFPLPLRVDFMYNRFGLDEDAFSGGEPEGNSNILGGSLNAVINIPTQSPGFRPYLTGGLGFYRAAVKVDNCDSPECDDSETGFGLNGGGGFVFPLTGFDTFIEARFVSIFGDAEAGVFPVVVGVRF